MTEKELDLLQFPALHMAEFRHSAGGRVERDALIASLGAPSDDVPDDILGYSFTPRCPMSAHGSEDSARGYFRRLSPSIDRLLDPSWQRNGTDMTTFANQVHDGPMSLPDLQILNSQREISR
jgi:hypothetical protein